jgi:Flp pilus assembly protein TadB
LGAAGLVALAGPTAAIPAVAVVGLCVVARRHRQLHRPTAGGSVALVADVIAGALGAGMRQPQALAMAARVAAQPLAGQLVEVSRALDAGLPPAEVWRPLAADPVLAGLARACSRGADTGAAIGPELGRLAVRLRREARADGERRAARAAVWLVLPLGACFLPAFVLVTVVPIVIGLVGRLR